MGLIGIVCVHRPNSQLSVAFVDQIFPHSFSADSVSDYNGCSSFFCSQIKVK